MTLRQRHLVVLPVHFSNQSQLKVRPALVISNNRINASSKDVVLVPLTSVLKRSSYSLPLSQADLSQGTLITKSRVRVDKIFTAEQSTIYKKIGVLKKDTFEKVKKLFCQVVS